MEARQTAVCFKNSKTSLQTGGEKSNAESNERLNAKRSRNTSTTGAAELYFDVNDNNCKVKRMRLIDDLPVEMLEAILRNVDTSDLINCRHVNRKWNIISSRIMTQRADIQITFSFRWGQLRNIQNYKSMDDLIGCLEQSTHFPISNFGLKDLGLIGIHDLRRFLSIWGKNIQGIAVNIDDVHDSNNAEMLRGVLEKTPNLKRLGIEFSWDWLMRGNDKSPVHLFTASNKFELPQLKELRVRASLEKFSGIVEDILEAAPNLKLFEKCLLQNDNVLESVTAKELTILHSMVKLHCLKNVSFMFREDVITCLEELPQIMDQHFESLYLPVDWLLSGNDQLTTRATRLMNKIFASSRNSLLKLNIPPLGWLSGLVLPKFENLKILKLTHDEEQQDDMVYCMFPLEFDMADSFPNLQQLIVSFFGEDEYFSTYEPVKVMPKVEYLEILFDDRYDEHLMKMTPNVKTMFVLNISSEAPSLNFHEIYIHLPKLENLNWETYGKSQHDLQSSGDVDTLITGYSKTFCKVKSVEFRDRDHLPQQEVASYEPYRRYASLVDLKALRRFQMTINLEVDSYKTECDCDESDCECSDADDDESRDKAGFNRASVWYRSSLTKVSAFLAFDLMPDLKTEVGLRITG